MGHGKSGWMRTGLRCGSAEGIEAPVEKLVA
jgi:hypothetical protein